MENTDIYGVVTEGQRTRMGKGLAVSGYFLLFVLILLSCASLFDFFYEVNYAWTAVLVVIFVVMSPTLSAPRFVRSQATVWLLWLWSGTVAPCCLLAMYLAYEWQRPWREVCEMSFGHHLRWGALIGYTMFAIACWAFFTNKPKNKGGQEG
ncbi:MAG: hypothetical protein BWY43_00008 [candidate division WS2 bacterium ADurb.Bin280]|uniref:Uncharacterized protein n=1 Tax=candidate division WS2 bacterium ADurb.Bin280 TaxID=1852829 RepID=A0A1V5SG60_9BACT|nr:MAG: hypothetical protein BWY43_00008 [candidate division WS2 bacterium ADurb.Bin280]